MTIAHSPRTSQATPVTPALADTAPTFLTNAEAAAHLKLSPRTLEKKRVLGGGPRFRKHGHCVRYTLADLDAWSASYTFDITSDPEYTERHAGR